MRIVSAANIQVKKVNVSTGGPPASHAQPAFTWLKRGAVVLSLAVVVTAGAATLAAFAARNSWLLELTSHFRLQYFWALAAALAVLAVARWKKAAILAAALAAINLALIVPLYFGPVTRAGAGPSLRAMSFNVHYLNRNHEATLALIAAERPDFILLSEVTPEWTKALEVLRPDYPYQQLMPNRTGGGLAFYSRHAITDLGVHGVGNIGLPTLVVGLDSPAGRLTLVGTHTTSPGSPKELEERNLQLEQVARLARARSGAVIVLGDLNTTVWSPYFQDLLVASGLEDSRRGFGVQPSWPSIPIPLLRIPIDHCLVSRAVSVLDRRVGPHLGSDHRPLLVDFALVVP